MPVTTSTLAHLKSRAGKVKERVRTKREGLGKTNERAYSVDVRQGASEPEPIPQPAPAAKQRLVRRHL